MRVFVMSSITQHFEKQETLILGDSEPDLSGIELLQQILIKQQHRQVTYEEARDIGDSLIEFFQVLAEEVIDEPSS